MRYLVRDQDGNVYGPADPQMLRDWVGQGRIIAGMSIAPENTREWMDAAQHPAIADLLQPQAGPGTALASTSQPLPSPIPAEPTEIGYGSPSLNGRMNIPALLSLIFGGVSIVSMCGFCIPILMCLFIPLSTLMALAAIVLGAIGLWQMKQSPGEFRGRGFAIAGISMGGGMMLLGVIGIVVGAFIAAKGP